MTEYTGVVTGHGGMLRRTIAKRKPQHPLGRSALDRDIQGQSARAAVAANVLDQHYVNILCDTLEESQHLPSGCDSALPRPNQLRTIAARSPTCAAVAVRRKIELANGPTTLLRDYRPSL